jgi:hypothetical protein
MSGVALLWFAAAWLVFVGGLVGTVLVMDRMRPDVFGFLAMIHGVGLTALGTLACLFMAGTL